MGNKEQWDYTGNRRIGHNPTLAENDMFAIYVNPFTEVVKQIRIEEVKDAPVRSD